MLVDFYHLASTPLERVLPRICERLLENEERLLLVAGEEQLAQLDELLWTYSPDAFLPHGRSDGRDPGRQPILLSGTVEALNGATNVALADGVWRDEALAFARTFYFFDNGHLDTARTSWRSVKSNPEATPRYWKQDPAGKWVQGP
jgi:DNA polymerase-3 subunit chi